jgi:hypothetical protein
VIDDADFTPNPARAIWISGEINEALVDGLEPQIAKLTSQSSDAITLYINSRGGLTRMIPRIIALLIATEQPGVTCNRTIIAVGVERAQSAAAQLLSIADRAYVRPGCALLYHGTRHHTAEAITGGVAAMFLESARLHDNWAISIFIGSCSRRFLSIACALSPTFAECRSDARDPTLTDLECFQSTLRSRLSPSGQIVMERAASHLDRYNRIVAFFQKKIATGRIAQKNEVQRQRAMLSAAIQFEYQSSKSDPDWDLTHGGLSRITEHYCLLDEHLVLANADVFGKICEELSQFTCGAEDLEQQVKLGKTREFLEPFWFFFLAICRALRDGENRLTPMDAVWLGLVDSIREDAGPEHVVPTLCPPLESPSR